MKSLTKQIQDVLTPNNSIGLIKKDTISKLNPLFPLSLFCEIIETFDDDKQQHFKKFLVQKGIIIFNGIIYEKSRELNLEGRLKEILIIYNKHLKKIIGEKKGLLKLYENVSPYEITNLLQDHVIFGLKTSERTKKKELVAMRFLPAYEIHFEKETYQMPSCTIIVHIDDNLQYGNPEIMTNNKSNTYYHPFVYQNKYNFGQKMCMGSFYNSTEQKHLKSLSLANSINYLIKQSVQILITGYNRNVNPANGHLSDEKYNKFLKK